MRPELWDHVRHRMDALNDRRLDDSTIAALRETMPRALVTTIVELAAVADSPARLVNLAARWRVKPGLVDDMLGAAAARMLERVEAASTQALVDFRGGDAHGAAALLEKEALPLLKRVDQLIADKPNQEVANTKDGVAIAFNNCAMALMNSPREAGSTQIRRWLDIAATLASAADTRRTVSANASSVDDDEKIREALRPFGLGLGGDGLPAYTDRVVALAKRGEFEKALRILDAIRPVVTDPLLAETIDDMTADVQSLQRYGRVRPGTAPSESSAGCLALFVVFIVAFGVVFAVSIALGANPVLAAIIALFFAIMSLGVLG